MATQSPVVSGLTAADVKDALRRRYPAMQTMGNQRVPGGWTCVEELNGIDLLAFSAHASPASGGLRFVRYPRIGHEIKVSRSDYRRELLKPHKRGLGVEWCNAFYFVVPKGLLTEDEIAYVEPVWEPDDFRRTICIADGCNRGTRLVPFIGPLPSTRYGVAYRWTEQVKCGTCSGRGYIARSRVETEAPTLWIPADVGLIEVGANGCKVRKPSPTRREVPAVAAGLALNDLIRWISARPDPRHAEFRRDWPLYASEATG